MTELPAQGQDQDAARVSTNTPARRETGAVRAAVATRRESLLASLSLLVITTCVVVANLSWVHANRRGLPFDIDEAGYLQRALRDDDALRGGGLSGLWHAYRLPDPQAPMLTMVAALWRHLTHSGPVGLIASEQLFVLIVVAATFVLARRLGRSIGPALVAAACAAALPGVIDGGRSFAFALPAAAFMTATLASQLVAKDFERLGPALGWGAIFGLAMLSRTVMLALLPAAALAAVARLVLHRAGRRQWMNFGVGMTLALVVASTWYSATWSVVWDYLTAYGYGGKSATYGRPRPLSDWHTWTFRLVRAMNTEVYLPLAFAGVVCAVIAVGLLTQRRRRLRWHKLPARVSQFLGGDWGTVTLVLAVDYAVLSSTRNVGSYFELPLLPAAAALLVSAASIAGRARRLVALTIATGAATVSIAMNDLPLLGQAGTRPIVRLGPIQVVAWDNRGPLVSYSTPFVDAAFGGTTSLLRRWQRSNDALSRMLFEQAARHGKPAPVVFFAVQDPFVNTNSLALLAQERGVSLPVGLLAPPRGASGESYAEQLQDPKRGLPDVLIIGAPPTNRAAKEFTPNVSMPKVRRAARDDGFRPTGGITLPDGRHLELWWRISG